MLILWVPKTCATWPDAPLTADRWLLGPAPARAWDDLRLVGVKLIFLIVTRAVSLLGLSRREWWWKDCAPALKMPMIRALGMPMIGNDNAPPMGAAGRWDR